MLEIPGDKLLEVLLEAEILQKKAAIEQAVRENPRLLATPQDTVSFDELQTYGQGLQPQFLAAAIERIVPSVEQQRKHIAQANAKPSQEALAEYFKSVLTQYDHRIVSAIGSNTTVHWYRDTTDTNPSVGMDIYEKGMPKKIGAGLFAFTVRPETRLAAIVFKKQHLWWEKSEPTFTIHSRAYDSRFMAAAWPALKEMNDLLSVRNSWYWKLSECKVVHEYAVIK